MKPNRSDVHLSPEESAKIEQQTRQYFDSIAPKRPPKPARSDLYSTSTDETNNIIHSQDSYIPQLQKLTDLKSNPQTGTGFIKVEMHADVSNNLNLSPISNGAGYQCSRSNSYRGNPATNDWIPSTDTVIPASNKPSRSDV